MNLVGDDRHYPQDFDKFVRHVFPGGCPSICESLGDGISRIDYLVRLENLTEDLAAIPEFPANYVLSRNGFASDYDRPFDEYFSCPETEERVWATYESDFASFSYPRYCYS